MSLKLITLAALGTAAQAATTYPYSKAKCITGHTSNFMKANGVPLVVIDSTAGFCFPANVEAYTGDKTTKSMLLRCVGTFLFYFPKFCLIIIFHLNFSFPVGFFSFHRWKIPIPKIHQYHLHRHHRNHRKI